MPTYTVRNTQSGELLSKRLRFSEYEAIKSGSTHLETEDGVVLELVFDPGSVGFVLKDGESGGWASKSLKENKYRQGRTREMARRESDHVFKSRLVPNYQGQEASSWSEVREHVRGVQGFEAAGTYDSLVKQEQGATT